LNGKKSWEQTRQIIQVRQFEALPDHPVKHAKASRTEIFQDHPVKNAKALRTKILQLLNQASDDGILAAKQADLWGLIKLTSQPQQGVMAVMVGAATKNFKRDPAHPHIRRKDGAWFDFSILVDETPKTAEIIGFDFELRFPEGFPVHFLRYDLNTPGHNNQDDGLRFHIHPGSDDLMIHSAPLTPIEILQQFLYGLPVPTKPRATPSP
jgi:hypothetical protein